jgi:hypothetical protein
MAGKSPLGGPPNGGSRFAGMPQRGESSTALLSDNGRAPPVSCLSVFHQAGKSVLHGGVSHFFHSIFLSTRDNVSGCYKENGIART